MKVTFWGVRGSIPAPGKNTVKYGGNTSCIEVYTKSTNQVLILDAGTGIRELGNNLMKQYKPGTLSCNILLTHTHWDHVQGFPFFVPAFISGNSFKVYGPVTSSINENNKKPYLSLKDLFIEQMRYQYFPVKLDEMKAESKFNEIKEGSYELDGIKIKTKTLNHPVLCMSYRILSNDTNNELIYCTDSEPYINYFINKVEEIPDDFFDSNLYENLKSKLNNQIDIERLMLSMEENLKLVDFCKNAHTLIYDSQYKKDEYPKKLNWGHSRVDDAVSIACHANVKNLYLFHHDPCRSDNEVDEMLEYARELAVSRYKNKEIKIYAAEEGLSFEV